jgi:aspartyl-tRNA(Asn)/glutamyl-tRNA(Gln) amidotransferase subunit A
VDAPGGAAVTGADLAYAGVAALSRALRARVVSPVAVAEACLGRADALAGLGCLAFVARDRAGADARAAEAELADGRWRGPLHGVPYVLADVVDTRGIPTALGVSALAARTPGRDATVAARLAEQGAVLVGKVAVLPLAGALRAGAGAGGGCRTPWDPARAAGGPSPGAAAAVGAGLVPFAVGVHGAAPDPAPAECGVTALRPTYGVLSRRGATLASYGLGALGPVARSAEDCALVLEAAAGPDPRDASSIAAPPGLARSAAGIPSGLRVGVLASPAGGAGEPLAAAQETLRAAGALVAAATLPELPWVEAAALLEAAEAEVIAGAAVPGAAPGADPAGATAADYVRAARLRGEAQRTLARLFERHDLVLAPAPRAGESDPLSAAIALGGLPALAFPAGVADGRPAGVRLVAPPLEEGRLLSAAATFQARTPHHLNRPPGAPPPALVTRR